MNENLDHGNFLELLLLISKFDPVLKLHIEDAINKSKAEGKGRGSLVTLFSKTTANNVIDVIHSLMKETLATEIRDAEMFSIQIDTTQDINVVDQCSIIIRYAKDRVYERLISLVNCISTTGEDLCNLICEQLKNNNIDISKCIGNCTDGASNMQGAYEGFNAWLNKVSPGQIHTWCYANVLNLIIADITQKTAEAISLFGLLNTCAVFLRESYKRMNVWREFSKFKFIAVVGETRWWAKDKILRKVFGNYNSTSSITFYVDVIQTFQDTSVSSKFNNDVRYKAKCILDSLLQFKTILIAQMFLCIFEETTPLSLYLQTRGMDIITAFKMVKNTADNILKITRSFDEVFQAAVNFVSAANKELEKRDIDIFIEPHLDDKRKRNTTISAKDLFRINVHNIIMDNVMNGLNERFLKNDNVYMCLLYTSLR